jgi:hypothetical protein
MCIWGCIKIGIMSFTFQKSFLVSELDITEKLHRRGNFSSNFPYTKCVSHLLIKMEYATHTFKVFDPKLSKDDNFWLSERYNDHGKCTCC